MKQVPVSLSNLHATVSNPTSSQLRTNEMRGKKYLVVVQGGSSSSLLSFFPSPIHPASTCFKFRYTLQLPWDTLPGIPGEALSDAYNGNPFQILSISLSIFVMIFLYAMFPTMLVIPLLPDALYFPTVTPQSSPLNTLAMPLYMTHFRKTLFFT